MAKRTMKPRDSANVQIIRTRNPENRVPMLGELRAMLSRTGHRAWNITLKEGMCWLSNKPGERSREPHGSLCSLVGSFLPGHHSGGGVRYCCAWGHAAN